MVTLARLQKEWGRPGELPALEVKRGLLYIAHARLLSEMFQPERVRFGDKWCDGGRLVCPAEWLYGRLAVEAEPDYFDLATCPSAADDHLRCGQHGSSYLLSRLTSQQRCAV